MEGCTHPPIKLNSICVTFNFIVNSSVMILYAFCLVARRLSPSLQLNVRLLSDFNWSFVINYAFGISIESIRGFFRVCFIKETSGVSSTDKNTDKKKNRRNFPVQHKMNYITTSINVALKYSV